MRSPRSERTKVRGHRLLWSLVRIAVASVIGFYAFAGGYLWLKQDSMVYLPPDPLGFTPSDLGLEYEEVRMTTQDGVDLHGWYVSQPATKSQPDEFGAVLLYFHGNAESISNLGYFLARWNAAGFETLVIDYRGYGRSGGRPSEDGTYLDAQAAWEYLMNRGVPAEHIVVWGRSLGGAVAAWLASRHTPAALVLESTFTSVPDLATEIYPWLPVRWLSRYRYDSADRLSKITCPVLIAHSPDDEIIPFRHAEELFAAAGEPKRIFELEGGHNDGADALRLVLPALIELLAAD